MHAPLKDRVFFIQVLEVRYYGKWMRDEAEAAKNGTKLARGANFQCLMSGMPIAGDYIKAEGKAGRMGERLTAMVAEGERGGFIYLQSGFSRLSISLAMNGQYYCLRFFRYLNPR